MNFLYKHEKAGKIIFFVGLVVGSVFLALILRYFLHSNIALILNLLGLSYLFVGSVLASDALGRWGAHDLWTYKYGGILQGIGFVVSLSGVMAGEAHFSFPSIDVAAEWVSAIANVVVALATLLAVAYAILQFQFNKRDKDERERPYVFVDLESINNTGLFNLVVRNTGSSPARNIKIEFMPDIKLHDYSQTTINSMKMMQDMKFLAPGKTLQFYFGSVIGGQTVICQEFKLKITYKSTKGTEYQEEQVLDPRDYLELGYISQKDINDIAKSLEVVAKSLEKAARYHEETANNLLRGVTTRNAGLYELGETELKNMLFNIVRHGHKYELALGSASQDTKAVIRALRNKLLVKENPSAEDTTMITRLSNLLMDRFMPGGNDFEDNLKELANDSGATTAS